MNTQLKKAAVLLGAFLLEYSVIPNLTVFSFSANLCVLALVVVCYFSSVKHSLVWGGVLGLVTDAAVGRRVGVQLLLGIYLAAAVKLFADEKINNSPAIMSLYMFPFTFMYYIAYGLLSGAVPSGNVGVGRWLLTAAVTAGINMIISLPLLWGLLRHRARRGGNG